MTDFQAPQPAQAPAQVLQSCLRDFAAIAIEEGSELKPTAELVDALIKASTPESPIGRMRDALAAIPAPEGELREAAQAVLKRWDSPLWRQEVGTADLMRALRAALAAQPHPADYKAALAARSATAIACLPDAPYKASLQRLHDDMLAAIAAQSASSGVSSTAPGFGSGVSDAHGIPAPQTKEPTNDR